MSNLSKRVEKAKKLVYSHSSYRPGHWATWGSKDSEYGKKYYRVALTHQKETILILNPDGKKYINITVFIADCQKDTGNGKPCVCPDVEYNHAVCKHSLGAIYRSFEQAKVKRLVSFFETYEAASQMNFGGKVAKVKSMSGPGIVWCVVKDWPESRKEVSPEVKDFQDAITKRAVEMGRLPLSVQENIDLMRGSEDEGID